MPELPEVETVKSGLAPIMENSIIKKLVLNRPNLRFPFPENFAKRVKNKKIVSLGRRAKYLLVDLDSDDIIIMHLGMSGSFRIETDSHSNNPGAYYYDKSKKPAHDHVVFRCSKSSGSFQVIYNDPRRFGFMDIVERNKFAEHPYFINLGVEPVGNALSSQLLADLFINKNTSIKAALLDQRLIAGLGNIYVCEALHEAGISPLRTAESLVLKSGKPSKKLRPLSAIIRGVIEKAIKAGGSSLRDHRQADGTLGYFQHCFKAYDQEGALCSKIGCNGTILRITQSGRSTFYCPNCQT